MIANWAWRCMVKCLVCGAEIAERAQACGRCGAWAPVEYPLYVTQDRAAGAAYDAAGGPAPAAIHAGAGQQRPESASDPDVDAAERAGTRAFSTTRLRPGYDIDQVDAFLSAIRDTFLGIREPSLTPDEIRGKMLSVTRFFRPSYAVEEVDALIDEAESRLAAQVRARGEAPAASQPSLAADMQAGVLRVRCLQCGSESAEAARVCARCGGPVTRQKGKMGCPSCDAFFHPGRFRRHFWPWLTHPQSPVAESAGGRLGQRGQKMARSTAIPSVSVITSRTWIR
jgi:DivIVA domain-containing protein